MTDPAKPKRGAEYERAAQVLHERCPEEPCAGLCKVDAGALGAAGLLADPGLRAELEQERLRLDAALVACEDLDRVLKQRTAERDLLLWLHAEAVWRVTGFDALTVSLARMNKDLTVERDQARARKQADLDELKKRLGIAHGTLTQHCERRDAQDAEIARLNALLSAGSGINIRFAAEDDTSRFVEIEDDKGRSIRIGTITSDPSGEWSIRITAADLHAALQGDAPTEPAPDLDRDPDAPTEVGEPDEPCFCGGRRWVEDKNWSPQYPELWKGERSPGNGLVPCGTCNFGGWNVDPVEPSPIGGGVAEEATEEPE